MIANKKPKIMILQNMISPYRNPLFEELSKKYDLTIYFCKEIDKKRVWSTNLKDYSFKYKILPHINIGNFVFNYSLMYELQKQNYDAYLCGGDPESFLQGWRLLSFCNSSKIPFVFWSGNTIGSVKYYKGLNKKILSKLSFNFKRIIEDIYLKKVIDNSNSVISYSKATDNYLISKGFDKNKIFTGTQNYPESLLLKPTWKTKPKEFKDKKIIFHIGYLNERKGINYLIEAFNKLKREDTILLIAGIGEDEMKLKELAKKNKNIIFLGYKDGIEKANYYSIADFFVFPTLYDVWGHVVTESFYYGKPVICTDKAEAKELITNGKTGFIVPDKNSDALAEAMKKLLDNPKLLKQMKDNVNKIPKSKIVDIKTTAKTFEKAINYALNNETTKTTNKKAK